MYGQGHCDLLITDLVITLQVGGDLTSIKLMTLNLSRSSYCATERPEAKMLSMSPIYVQLSKSITPIFMVDNAVDVSLLCLCS